MKEIQSIGVYCSSYDMVSDIYKQAAAELGEQLAKRNITLIYGGGARGLMGELARATMKNQGKVIGFMTQNLSDVEEPTIEITELHMVETMHMRKRLIFENSDAFFVLPGGFGTLDEAFELITWRQLSLHEKPIIFININGYWSLLKEFINSISEQHFAKPEHMKCFQFVSSVMDAFHALFKVPEPVMVESGAEWI